MGPQNRFFQHHKEQGALFLYRMLEANLISVVAWDDVVDFDVSSKYLAIRKRDSIVRCYCRHGPSKRPIWEFAQLSGRFFVDDDFFYHFEGTVVDVYDITSLEQNRQLSGIAQVYKGDALVFVRTDGSVLCGTETLSVRGLVGASVCKGRLAVFTAGSDVPEIRSVLGWVSGKAECSETREKLDKLCEAGCSHVEKAVTASNAAMQEQATKTNEIVSKEGKKICEKIDSLMKKGAIMQDSIGPAPKTAVELIGLLDSGMFEVAFRKMIEAPLHLVAQVLKYRKLENYIASVAESLTETLLVNVANGVTVAKKELVEEILRILDVWSNGRVLKSLFEKVGDMEFGAFGTDVRRRIAIIEARNRG
jgi:hypothetical protein